MTAKIDKSMKKIARRKPGRSRLVYDKATKSIVVIDPLNPSKKGKKIDFWGDLQ